MAKSKVTLANLQATAAGNKASDNKESGLPYKVNYTGIANDRNAYTDKSGNGVDPIAQKYSVAVTLGLDEASRMDHEVSDDELKGLIDAHFDQLNPVDSTGKKVTGREVRGDTLWTDFIGGAKQGLNGFNSAIGSGLDWGVDRIGDLAGWFTGNDELAQSIKDATTGEDLAFIPSIAEDIGLAMIPGVGMPLVLGKALTESSDDLARAVNGVDPITMQAISGGERGAAGAGAAINTVLSMIPGASMAKGAEKGLLKTLAPGASKEAKEGLKKAKTNLEGALKQRSELQSAQTKELTRMKDEIAANVPDSFAKGVDESAAIAALPRELRQMMPEDILKQTAPYKNALDNVIGKAYRESDEFGKAVGKAKKTDEAYLKATKKYDAKAKTVKELEKQIEDLEKVFTPKAQQMMTYMDSKNPFVRVRSARYLPTRLENGQAVWTAPFRARKAAYEAENGNVFRKAIAAVKGDTRANIKKAEKEYEKQLEKLIKDEEKAIKEAEEAAKKAKKEGKETSDKKGFAAALARRMNASERAKKALSRGGRMKGLSGPGTFGGTALSLLDMAIQENANGAEGGLPGALAGYASDVANGDFGSLLPLALAFAPGPRKRVSRALGRRSGTPVRSTMPYYAMKMSAINEGLDRANQTAGRYTVDDEAMDFLAKWLQRDEEEGEE